MSPDQAHRNSSVGVISGAARYTHFREGLISLFVAQSYSEQRGTVDKLTSRVQNLTELEASLYGQGENPPWNCDHQHVKFPPESLSRQLETTIYTLQRCQLQRRLQSTAAVPGAAGKVRVSQIVEDISRLTLLETADLVTQLKAKLKIADIAMPMAAAPAGAGAPAAAAEAPAEEAAPAAAEKAILTVKLDSFDASAKAKVIREVKALLGCNLVEAKTLVEKAPTVIKENVVKEDAHKLKETMEKLGAKITLV